ncbi:MAG: PIN domain-containing protein [Luteitalea sp.]|nr:PIN domain-containing protein [Luteitalea sp.]
MRSAYFDASAVVKLCTHEPESLAVVDYLQEPIEASTCTLAITEAGRALRRGPVHPDEAASALDGFHLIALHSARLREAATLDPPSLRPLDAIHLACALAIGDDNLDFVTYDARLAEAARAHGLRVVQPGR